MPGSWGYNLRSPGKLAIALLTILISNPVPGALGLKTTGGSPCASICNQVSTNTTASEIVCLDNNYDDTKGKTFEECVSCQLKSTYVDRLSGETDVNWGLCESITTNPRGLPQMANEGRSKIICDTHLQRVSLDSRRLQRISPLHALLAAAALKVPWKSTLPPPARTTSTTGARQLDLPIMSSMIASSAIT